MTLTTEFCVVLGDLLISWKSKKQPNLSHSSAEAEYRVLALVTSELLWILQILRVFEVPCLLSWRLTIVNLQLRFAQIR